MKMSQFHLENYMLPRSPITGEINKAMLTQHGEEIVRWAREYRAKNGNIEPLLRAAKENSAVISALLMAHNLTLNAGRLRDLLRTTGDHILELWEWAYWREFKRDFPEILDLIVNPE